MHKNGQMWYDDAGAPIQAHGGMILEHEGTYYWYGEHKGQDNCPGTTRVDVIGVSCYSSKNMVDWHYEGLVLDVKEADPDSLFRPENVCERPKVLYNKKTKKFVLWVHMDSRHYEFAGVGIAVSDSPTGPFTLQSIKRPNGTDSRDMTVFVDEDDQAYLFHSSNWNRTMNVARLTEDYTDLDGFYVSILADQAREAPAVIKKDHTYYMVSSGCTGWAYNSALYARSAHVMGQWRLIDNPCEGPGYRDTFKGQSTYLFTTKGKTFLMLDHWIPKDLRTSGYSILPVTFEERETMTVHWSDEFSGV